MRTLLFILAIFPLSAGEDPMAGRTAALLSARHGDWRDAELHQRQAIAACGACTVEDRAVLRAELAGYLTLGGFPEAAVAVWKQSLAELPAGSRLERQARVGLGVALHSAGRTADAEKVWAQACGGFAGAEMDAAACRFNLAVARMGAAGVWSELEAVLPVLLRADGAISRVTALIQTAEAAVVEGPVERARQLTDQAEAIIVGELSDGHPFLMYVFEVRAQAAVRDGDSRGAKLWRKKARNLPAQNGWRRGTVSLDELRRDSAGKK